MAGRMEGGEVDREVCWFERQTTSRLTSRPPILPAIPSSPRLLSGSQRRLAFAFFAGAFAAARFGAAFFAAGFFAAALLGAAFFAPFLARGATGRVLPGAHRP